MTWVICLWNNHRYIVIKNYRNDLFLPEYAVVFAYEINRCC